MYPEEEMMEYQLLLGMLFGVILTAWWFGYVHPDWSGFLLREENKSLKKTVRELDDLLFEVAPTEWAKRHYVE
jgi:hypothetical protein